MTVGVGMRTAVGAVTMLVGTGGISVGVSDPSSELLHAANRNRPDTSAATNRIVTPDFPGGICLGTVTARSHIVTIK